MIVIAAWSTGLGACPSARSPEPAASSPSAAKSASAATSGGGSAAKTAAAEPAPLELHLEVLHERLDVGLAIQNRAAGLQRFAPSVHIVPAQGGAALRTLSLRPGQDGCMELAPGAEWLWPADWGLSLAPDQAALKGLDGQFRFELQGCEGSASVVSTPVHLPARYFPAPSGKTK